jgi:tRNA-splicing ligase RtcB
MSADVSTSRDWREALRRLDAVRWELPVEYMPGMRVPGLVLADDALMDMMAADMAIQQVANVATLPGIVGRSIAMPDVHWGYGFPIGGVAATRASDGVVSPGGVGFDINCGVRLLRTPFAEEEVAPGLKQLADQIFRDVPVGTGSRSDRRLSAREEESVLAEGAAAAVRLGYGTELDLETTESGGVLPGADIGEVSERARQRGLGQLGTLGAGNHFLEIQKVARIHDVRVAEAFGLNTVGQVVVSIHTGSRGLGHQVCQDFLSVMQHAMEVYEIDVPDKQLACAPVESPEGRRYLGAMAAAANFAWANRQAITGAVRYAFKRVLGVPDPDSAINVLYDVAHNIAKLELHSVEEQDTLLCVHRKGATRAFPSGHAEVPACYRHVGQPVLVPGDMGRASYVCVGLPGALAETWGSSCHGAGRALSRHAAVRSLAGVDVAARLAEQGVLVRTASRRGLAEEASEAYKDVHEVVSVLERASIASVVAELRPLAVIKG